jgi:hypothetical protein
VLRPRNSGELCHNPDDAHDSVVIPVATQLLVIDRAHDLDFFGLDWAHTYQPLPTMGDGITPGYAAVQTGIPWNDQSIDQNNITSAAITMLGAQNVGFRACRVAHTGGTGIIVGTKEVDGGFYESNSCQISQGEFFDLGAHGVYVGDEFAHADVAWHKYDHSDAGHDPTNWVFVERCKIQNYGVVYRDSVGIYFGHTRDIKVADDEVSYGNYDGIVAGTGQVHHLDPAALPPHRNPGDPVCDVFPITVPQQTEGTKINRCDIHHVMLQHTDGGAIYMQGSHLKSEPYASHANPSPGDNGRQFSGEINGNWIHDIVLNPFLNHVADDSQSPPTPLGYSGQYTCHAFYFEAGSDGWHPQGNYIERVQGPYTFATYGFRDSGGACRSIPSAIQCDGGIRWQQPTWPQDWHYLSLNHDSTTATCDKVYIIPGQQWSSGGNPNYWLYAPGGGYGDYISGWQIGTGPHTPPNGYGYPNNTALSGLGGMHAITRFSGETGSVGNVLVTGPGQEVDGIDHIIRLAGPGDDLPGWFFPDAKKQIHRRYICSQSEPLGPETQVQ